MLKSRPKRKHGLHRPGRCCIQCHEDALAHVGLPSGTVPFRVDPVDPGPQRSLAAKIQTSEAAGDRW